MTMSTYLLKTLMTNTNGNTNVTMTTTNEERHTSNGAPKQWRIVNTSWWTMNTSNNE